MGVHACVCVRGRGIEISISEFQDTLPGSCVKDDLWVQPCDGCPVGELGVQGVVAVCACVRSWERRWGVCKCSTAGLRACHPQVGLAGEQPR